MTPLSAPAAVVPPSVIILGSDAMLAALPATPTQLANACYAAGYEGVFPASWGDELVAAGCLKDLETRMGPVILCSCPLVKEQLRGVAPLQRFQLHLVPPPVAAARYLRALCEDAPLRVTYVGDCPGAEDQAIDERISPPEFLRRLSERGITPLTQRPDLGANAPRDRRRFYSLPGGAPTPEWLSADWPKRALVETDAGAALADLAHHALARESTLIDFAPQLGCACSGAVGGIAPRDARRAVMALEPPRARQEVLDPELKVMVQAMVPFVRPSREVSWEEFLAALPATMSSAITPGETAAAPASAPAPSLEAPVPAAPAAPEPVAAARRSVPPSPPPDAVPLARPTPVPAAPSAAVASVRTTQPIPRRAPAAVVEGQSGPRYPAVVPRPAGLSAGDRWLLVGVVLGSSALSSALTAYLTVRALERRGDAGPVAVAPPPRDSAAEERAPTVPPPAIAVPIGAPPLGDQRTLAAANAAPAEPPKRSIAAAPARAPRTAPARVKAAPSRGTRAATPAPLAAPPALPAAEAVTVVHVAPTAPPPPPVTSAGASDSTRGATNAIAVPVAVPASTAAAAPAASPPSAPAAAPAATGVAAPAAPPAGQVDIAAELKAIRDELNARKRRVDSLTRSLDSLNKAAPPPPSH